MGIHAEWVVLSVLLCTGAVWGAGGFAYQQQQSYDLQAEASGNLEAQASLSASEVEYVDGPLAPLYDFLIQKRLFKFCKLLRDANLEDVLQGLGGYWTLFVPTDASFIFLPGGTLDQLKRNPQLLRDFLLYHFVTGDFTTSQALNEMLLDSAQGAPLRFNVYGQIMTVSGAQILEPDLQFELGRVHIIDHPLYPVPTGDIVTHLRSSHRELYRLLEIAGLIEYLNSGTFTILAPDDDAFKFLTEEFKDALATNTTLADRVLLNHILPGSVYTAGINDGVQLDTVGGEKITFSTKRGLIFANDIPIVLPDIHFTNGVIHTLNRVLLPEGVEIDCQCKPSTTASRSTSPQPPPRLPTPTQISRTTRKPNGQSFQRQPSRPSGGQPPGSFVPGRPSTSHPARPQPVEQPRPPFTPTRTGQPQNPFPRPGQIPASQFDQPATQPQPEIDLNTVSGPDLPGSQKKPDQGRTTRYPPPPPRTPSVTQPRGQPPQNVPENIEFPEQQISPGVTNAPWQTSRWSNRQQTQPPRQPPPVRNQHRSPSTTRRPQSTRATPPPVGKVPQPDISDQSHPAVGPQEELPTQSPPAQITSWQHRQQIAQVPKQQHQRTTTQRPARIPPPPQRRPTPPRNGGTFTRAPVPPQPSEQPPFESNRQRPNCRQISDIITPTTQNLPICTETPESDPCQIAPINPADPRPLCPNDILPSGCRDPNERFNPSDTRPICQPGIPGQSCRNANERAHVGDNRPLCSPLPTTQLGCRDPTAPFNPSDARPPCNNAAIPDQGQPSPPHQDCRTANEPSDNRPLCPGEIQEDCRPFYERPKAGDRRPLCQTNRQPSQPPRQPSQPPRQPSQPPRQPSQPPRQPSQPPRQPSQPPRQPSQPPRQPVPPPRPPTGNLQPPSRPQQPIQRQDHSTKGQSQPPAQQRPPFQQPQGQRFPNTQTTRRQSWQTTQRPQQITPPDQQQSPAPGNLLPPPVPPTGPQSHTRHQQPALQPPSVPNQIPPQIDPYPNPPIVEISRQTPPERQTIPPVPRSQTQRWFPQGGITQTPSFQGHRPNGNQGTVDVTPRQPFEPQRQPISPGRHQTTTFTPQPIRATFTPRIPTPANVQPIRGTNPPRVPVQVTNVQPVRVTTSPRVPGSVTNAQPVGGNITPRVPVSISGTSTTPGEDSKRTLYEIVEDPSLLIRGTPVKLTRIFELFHKAGIEDILLSPGPTTVFLPSDDAFASLPKGVIDQLEENPELLRQVLLYHVTNVEILPSAQSDSFTVPSLEGDQLVITMLNGGRLILISGAKAIAVTRANNGIFYVINQLLYPLPHHDIVGAIQSRPDLSTLSWLLSISGLTDMLTGQTPYTFLAPTDTAFSQLPQGFFDELSQNTSAAQEILLNHIIEGAHYGREFLTGGTFPSGRGGKLKFQVVSYGYQVNDINIKTPEIVTGTGVIHLIDQVLLESPDLKFISKFDNSVTGEIGPNDQTPPSTSLQTPAQPLDQTAPGIGPRQPAVNGQVLSGGQRQTNSRGGQTFAAGLQPPSRNHQSNQRQPNGHSASVTHRPAVGRTPISPDQRPFQRQPVNQPHTSGGQPSQVGHRPSNGQPTQPQNPLGGNGQQENVAELARAMGLNRFANWITNTGLLEKIHDGGVYTVFAPTDDAVNSLPQDMVNSIDANPAQTRPLLQYHIIPRKINVKSVTNDETSSTLLQGKSIRFNVYQGVQADCQQVVTASGTPVGDALATMGSIQVIPVTQVLYQPTGNLLSIIDASPILQSLSQAIKAARVSWVLSGTGPLTLFAPSDTAFQSLTPEQRKNLIDDKQAFSELIKKHLVRGTYFSSGVQEDVNKPSENNQPMTLSLQDGVLTVNSVPVTYSDITATNGVLHVIDHLL